MAGLHTGESIPCRCGREMTVRFTEGVFTGNFQAKRRTGDRYMYVCDGCGRRLDVRWLERDMRRSAVPGTEVPK